MFLVLTFICLFGASLQYIRVEESIGDISYLTNGVKLDNFDSYPDDLTRLKRSKKIEDIYRVSLSAHNPASKVVNVIFDHDNNETLVLFSTYLNFKEQVGFPFVQRRTSDCVFFKIKSFRKLIEFFMSDKNHVAILSQNIRYNIVKHHEREIGLVTIRMDILNDGTQNFDYTNFDNYKIRTFTLNSAEYQNLLNRASQILKDLEK